MSALYLVCLIILLIDCALLAIVVLFQDNRSGGLAGALGGGATDSAFGARTAEKMSRLTMYLAGAFFVLVLATGYFYRTLHETAGLPAAPAGTPVEAPSALPSGAPPAVPAAPAGDVVE